MKSFDSESHTYLSRRGRLPGATDIVKSAGLINPDWLTEYSRWRGSCVHRGIELINKKELDWETVDEEIKGYLKSYQQFLTISRFEIFGAEEPCFSDSFACLPDLWGSLNGLNTIIELKTGPVPPWAAFQTALQRRALLEDRGFKTLKRFGLRLLADGSLAKLQAFDDPMDDYRAMGLVDMFHWKVRNGYVEGWK